MFFSGREFLSPYVYACVVGLCLFLGNIKKDINAKNAKQMQLKNGPPKIRMQQKCKNNAKNANSFL